MRSFAALLLCLMLSLATTVQGADPLQPFVDLHKKLESGKTLTVAYIGGSITNGAGTHPRKGNGVNGAYDYTEDRANWRELTFASLAKEYPKAKLTMVHAAIGSTGSAYGAYRFDQHVLKHKPDLLFIEFVVNDQGSGIPTEQNPQADNSIYRTITSLVSRAREQNPSMAILNPLTTVRPDEGQALPTDAGFLASRKHHTAAAALLKVPTVDLTDACYVNALPGGVSRERIFDGDRSPGNRVHPSPHGHRAYAAAVTATLQDLFTGKGYDWPEVESQTFQPFPIRPKVFWPGQLPATKGWTASRAHGSPYPAYAQTKGMMPSIDAEPLRVTFKGSRVALAWSLRLPRGEPVGRCELWLDGKLATGLYADSKSKKGRDQPQRRYSEVIQGLDASKEHVLELRIPAGQEQVGMALLAICIDES